MVDYYGSLSYFFTSLLAQTISFIPLLHTTYQEKQRKDMYIVTRWHLMIVQDGHI